MPSPVSPAPPDGLHKGVLPGWSARLRRGPMGPHAELGAQDTGQWLNIYMHIGQVSDD